MPNLPRPALLRCVLGLVLALTSFASSGEAASPRAWVQVTSDTDTGLEIVLQAPPPERLGEQLVVQGFGTFGDPEGALVYENAILIGVPGSEGATWTVVAEERDNLGVVTPNPPAIDDLASQEAVFVTGPARLRGRDVVSLRFRPLLYTADGQATFVRRARLRIQFADRARGSTGFDDPDPAHDALLNRDTAARWAISESVSRSAPEKSARPLPDRRLRIQIPKQGLFELTYDDLRPFVPVEDLVFDHRSLRLFFDTWRPVAFFADSTPASWEPDYMLQEAALWVEGTQDGSFDPGDRVVFYSLGPEGYQDEAGVSSDSLEYAIHPYDRNYYGWLVWGDGEMGRRMQEESAAVDTTEMAPVRTRGRTRRHFEVDQQFAKVDNLWYWEELTTSTPGRVVGFDLDLGGETTTTGDLALAFGNPSSGNYGVDVTLNGSFLGTAGGFATAQIPHVVPLPNVTLQSDNRFQFTFRSGRDNRMFLLKFDVFWDRLLRRPSTGSLVWSAPSGTMQPEVFELSGFDTTQPLLFDVTDPWNPVRLTGSTSQGSGSATRWRFRHARAGTPRVHFRAARDPERGLALQLRTLSGLRRQTTSPDMVIVVHENLVSAANRLAEHRRSRFPGVQNPQIQILTTRDLYQHFSGGRVDPLAIRNAVKFLYNLESPPRLRYLVLMGDGNHDPKQLLLGSNPTLVPSFQPWYSHQRLFRQEYAVEDWLGEMETPDNGVDGTQSSTRYAVPDMAIGRFAARSAAEANLLIDKIIAYETTSEFGPWRSRVVFASDDECHAGQCVETFHINNSERLASETPSDLDPVKFYLTEFPGTNVQKPQARSEFIRTWSEGCAVLNYQGHGAPRQIADEVLFLSSDVPSLANASRLPLFLPISCTVSEFDEPDLQSMCEDLVASPRGGAIATIGATKPTFATPNFGLNLALFRELFGDGSTSRRPIGDVYWMAKTTAGDGGSRNNESFVLLGDPSLRLVLPDAVVSFTAGVDSLQTGRSTRIEGAVYAPEDSSLLTGFQGLADVEVFASADESGYQGPKVFIAYDLIGAPIYRGTVAVTNGEFAFSFFVPVGARVGGKGRVSAYAYSDASDAKGALDTVRIVRAASEEPSIGPPRITLAFPNQQTRVKKGTLLSAEIEDENGINIQGTSLRSSILLDFDRKSEPLDVTSVFRYEAGSASLGRLAIPLPELEPGPHSATLIASDNLSKTSSKSIDFVVVGEEVSRLVDVVAFPNPFRDRTHFFFEITDPGEVEVRVFTTSGRLVWRARERYTTGIRASLSWDGVDLLEDTLANGTYLYRVQVRPDRAGAPRLEHTGKVVLMR